MTRTLTIRLPGPALRQIQARARSLGVTPSELVRRLVAESPGETGSEPTAHDLTRQWVGRVSTTDIPNGRDARAVLHGWNPDRRG
jgi:hypothetical protein